MYKPPRFSHKGQNGRLLIVGGSKKYHGAPMLSILAARRFVDLVYFYPYESNDKLLYGIRTIPEVIVLDKLSRSDEFDCVLFGIGAGLAKKPKLISKILKESKRLVVDGDGLRHIKGKIPKDAILTPHEGEFRMLFGMNGTKENVRAMAKKHNCIILKKDPKGDTISDGKRVKVNKTHNQGMTKGGTGDVLSGFVAALYCRNEAFESAYAAAKTVGKAGNLAKKKFGFNYAASDLTEFLALALRTKKSA
ncbi:MAG: NAD(P)H-hydrate dehydratase [Candidatus Micrarchaeota archaeon]